MAHTGKERENIPAREWEREQMVNEVKIERRKKMRKFTKGAGIQKKEKDSES